MTVSEEAAESIFGSALAVFRTFSNWAHENPNRSSKPGSDIDSDITLECRAVHRSG